MSCILSIRPSHRILWHLINLTISDPLIMVSNSSFRRTRHSSFSFTGPYIFRKIFLSNIANVLSSSTVSGHDSEPLVTTGRTKVWYIWGATSFLYNGYRIPFQGVSRPGRDVSHPPPSTAEVKERVELYLYSPSWPL